MNSKERSDEPTAACCPHGNCDGVARRDFIKTLTLGAAAAAIPALPVMAGPFEASEQGKLVPADKKLDPQLGQVALRPRGPRGLSRQGLGEDRHAHRRTLRGPALPGRRRQALALGYLQQTLRAPATPTTPIRRCPRRRWNRVSPSRSRPAARGKCGPWTTRASPTSRFCGEYPIAYVEYRDPQSPVSVSLEAFSPHIPLDTQASSLPATVMRYTVKNTSGAKVEVQLAGWLENAVGLYTAPGDAAEAAEPGMAPARVPGHPERNRRRSRREIDAPRHRVRGFPERDLRRLDRDRRRLRQGADPEKRYSRLPGRRRHEGPAGRQFARLRPGQERCQSATAGPARSPAGRSRSSAIIIRFWIGGGNHPGETCINLLVDGKIVRTAAGHDSNQMRQEGFDVRKLQGKTARLEIVDKATGPWGNIGAGPIVFSDRRPTQGRRTTRRGHAGPGPAGTASRAIRPTPALAAGKFPAAAFAATRSRRPRSPPAAKLVGSIVRKLALEAGQEATATFVIAWHFPRLKLKDGGRFYATRFDHAAAVAEHLAANFASLHAQTRLWHDTWYDSTLPYWFLDRTLLNTSILATIDRPSLRDGPLLGLGGRRLLRGHLHARLALRPRRGPALSRAGTRSPQADRFRHGPGPADGHDQPPRRRRRAGGRRPGRLHPPRLSRAPDVPRRRLAQGTLAADQAGHAMPDPHGQGRRARRRGPAQHARPALVRQDRLAQFALPGGVAGLRGDGPRGGRRRIRRRRPARSSSAAAATSIANCSTANTTTRFPTRTTSAASARTTAARSTRSSGKAGPSRSGWAAFCRRAT